MDTLLDHAVDQSHQQRGTFTCQACAVAFHTPDAQRQHYRSDWHRYNLKRRVANLTPVSVTTFAEKVLAQKSLAATTAERANFAERCEPCGKTYYSENAYNNHLGSKRHKDSVRAALSRVNDLDGQMQDTVSTQGSTFDLHDSIEPSQASIYESSTASPAPGRAADGRSEISADNDDDDDEAAIEAHLQKKLSQAVKMPLGACLFCRTVQKGEVEGDDADVLAANVAHMVKMHSLFLPEQEYLVDLAGLVTYLQTKVAVGNFCLACNRGFRNLEACRAHMASVGHRRIAYETEEEQLELSDYYDFSASWRAEDRGGGGGDGEWEDASEVGSNDDDVEIVSDSGSDAASDDSIPSDRLGPVAEDFELRLPSGAVAGHRALARYFRQNFHNREPGTASVNLRGRDPATGQRLITDKSHAARQQLVQTSMAGVDASKKKWANGHTHKFGDIRGREEFKTRVGFRHNNQKHYRDPLLQ